jgi:uncharacterized protein
MSYLQREEDPVIKAIPVRRPRIDFEKGIKPYYLRENGVISHFITSLNFLFPYGEQFFVESVNFFKDRVQDSPLCSEIKAFCSQEIQHKNQHKTFINLIEGQSYPVQPMMRWMKWYFEKFLRSLPSGFRLAHTAGCEHFTAAFAHSALKNRMLDNADPIMRQLLLWHAIEEIEHKHVAFDVLQKVRHNNYIIRAFGFLTGILGIFGNTFVILGMLIRWDFQKNRMDFKQFKQYWINIIRDREVRNFLKDLFISLVKYLKPGFHPNQIKDDYLLSRYIPEVEKYS